MYRLGGSQNVLGFPKTWSVSLETWACLSPSTSRRYSSFNWWALCTFTFFTRSVNELRLFVAHSRVCFVRRQLIDSMHTLSESEVNRGVKTDGHLNTVYVKIKRFQTNSLCTGNSLNTAKEVSTNINVQRKSSAGPAEFYANTKADRSFFNGQITKFTRRQKNGDWQECNKSKMSYPMLPSNILEITSNVL